MLPWLLFAVRLILSRRKCGQVEKQYNGVSVLFVSSSVLTGRQHRREDIATGNIPR